jgi:hypothetical protein
MDKAQIRNLTARILAEVLEDFGEPRVSGQYVVFVENEPGDFRMAVVSDFEGLEDEFALATEGGVSLAVREAEVPGYYAATVAIMKHGEIFSATYTVSEFRLKGLWTKLKKDFTFLEELKTSSL